VSGRITDTVGNPIPNLHVYAHADNCWGPWLDGTQTDENGNYALLGLPSGPIVISACATCSGLQYVDEWYDDVYNCGDAQQVFIMPGQVTQGVDFALDSAGIISGHVFEEDGATGIYDVHVYAETYADPGGWVAGTMSRGDGGYSLFVPSGTYRVRACPTCSGQPYRDEWYDEDPGTPPDPEPIDVTAPGEVSGIDFALAYQLMAGDINGDLMIDLGDAILALQVVADLNPSGVHLGDANADGKVGLAEAIYVLQYESQLR
jgi:hypothetical protein